MAGPNFGISPMLLTTGGQKQVMLHEKSVLRPFGPEFLEYLDRQFHCFSKEIDTF